MQEARLAWGPVAGAAKLECRPGGAQAGLLSPPAGPGARAELPLQSTLANAAHKIDDSG